MERNNSMIPERLARLRTEMEKRHIAAYVVPTADFHESEYVGEHFKARKYITGFSGSAGTAVITCTGAGGVKATCNVHVVNPATGITLSEKQKRVTKGYRF